MKGRAGRIGLAVVLAAALLASVIGVSLVWSRPEGKAAEAKAAMPEGVAPTQTVTCGVCGKTAYRITALTELSYVVSQWGNGTAKTETCYVLDIPVADGEIEKKADISGWTDQSIGSVSEAYTGHFDGNGYKIAYEVTGENGSGVQKQGLFPQLKDAEIRNFTAVVKHTVSSSNAAYRSGGVVSQAKSSVIDNVTVSETFTRNVNATAGAGGIAGEIDKTSMVKNCAVTTLSSGDHSAYGGIVGAVTDGTVENCVFTLGGASPRIGDFGGIARTLSVENTTEGAGNIIGCKAYFPIAGATMMGSNVGGIVSVMYSGLISGCTAEVSVSGAEAPTSGLGGIAGSVLTSTSTVPADLNRQTDAMIEDCYTYTRRDADGLTGKFIGRTNVGGLVGTVGDSNSRKHTVVIRNCKVQIANLGSAASGVNSGGGLIGGAQIAAFLNIYGCTADTSVFGTISAGGLLGAINLWTGGLLQMTDCHSYGATVTQLSGGDNTAVGGAIGLLSCVTSASTGRFVIQNVTARANVINVVNYGGGLIGLLRPATSTGNSMLNCAAYGNVSGGGSYLGGLIGAMHSDTSVVNVVSCSATGNVTGALDGKSGNVGGFVGYNTARNSTFAGCTASGNVTGSYAVGGFVGYSNGSGIVYGTGDRAYGCSASGNVTGSGYATANRTKIGGFAGQVMSPNQGEHAFNYCSASGFVEIVKYEGMTGGIAGGFLGHARGVMVNSCAAYGDVVLTGAGTAQVPGYLGGFVGYVEAGGGHAQTKITDSVAYGNVVTKQGNTYYMGGFAGELFGTAYAVALINCISYGDVDGGPSATDIGSFVGHSYGWTGMRDCTAYGTVTGTGTGIGAWMGCVDGISGNAGAATLTNCKWVDSKSIIGRYMNGAGAPNTGCGMIAAPVLPKVTVEKNGGAADEQSATTLTFTFSGCEGYGMKSMYLSLDGGKTYTQLVYNGIPLVAGMTAGGISDLEDGTMTISYAAKSKASDVKVRIALSGGSKEIIKTL